MNFKITFTLFLMLSVLGCGSESDSPKGITDDLSHLKGEEREPDITELSFSDGREVYINSQISGRFSGIGNAHTFKFNPLNSQLVSISIDDSSGSKERIRVYVSNPELDYDESIISSITYGATSFVAIAGENYEITVFTDNGGGYTVKIADANRETMQLKNHEFYVSLVSEGEEQCNGNTKSFKSFQLYRIFNFRDASIQTDINQIAYYDLIDDYTIGFSSANNGRGNSSSRGGFDASSKTNHWYLLDPNTGYVSGERRREYVWDFDDPKYQTEDCISSVRYTGKIVL